MNGTTAVRDWVHENYQASFVLGTGLMALGAWLVDPRRRGTRALGAWAAALALGAALEPCVNVRSQTYGPVLSRGWTDQRVLALTFDDGPSVPETAMILDLLREEGVSATFFCVGAQVRRHPDLVRRMAAEGHLVGTHTENHVNLLACGPERSRREIQEGVRSLSRVLEAPPEWFRPPYGMRYPWTLAQARSLGLATALWSNCPRDWQTPGAEVLARRVLDHLGPGDVVLLHDGGGDRSQTVQALRQLIPQVRERGYRFVRVDELQESGPASGR